MKKRKRTGQPAYVAPNVVLRNFTATQFLERLMTDITYSPFGQSMMYLSNIRGLYNGEIVVYTAGSTQDIALVLDILNQPAELPEGCIFHSDQGSVYTSYAYQETVKKEGLP